MMGRVEVYGWRITNNIQGQSEKKRKKEVIDALASAPDSLSYNNTSTIGIENHLTRKRNQNLEQ